MWMVRNRQGDLGMIPCREDWVCNNVSFPFFFQMRKRREYMVDSTVHADKIGKIERCFAFDLEPFHQHCWP